MSQEQGAPRRLQDLSDTEREAIAGMASCGCWYYAEQGIPCEHDLALAGVVNDGADRPSEIDEDLDDDWIPPYSDPGYGDLD